MIILSKEKLRSIVVLIFVSMISILSYGLVISQMVENKYIYETLIIILTFIGLFATFGGAYIGAKISGDNARKLYEKQKKDEQKEEAYKIETLACIEFSKIIDNHDKLKNYSIFCKDTVEFEEKDNTLNVERVLGIYAIPIKNLLQKVDIDKVNKQLLEELVEILNSCNRYYNSFSIVDLEEIDANNEKVIINTNDKFRLYGDESDDLLKKTFEMKNNDMKYKAKYIVCSFIHEKMTTKLNRLFKNIKNEDIKNLFLESRLPSKESEGFKNKFSSFN